MSSNPQHSGPAARVVPIVDDTVEQHVVLDRGDNPNDPHPTVSIASPKPREPRRERIPPTKIQSIKPKTGLPKWKYRFNCLVGRPHVVPKKNKKEMLYDEIAFLEFFLEHLTQMIKIRCCFVNSKGGATKTTVAMYVSKICAYVAKGLAMFILPTTTSTTTSSIAENAGLKPKQSVSISELALRKGIKSYLDLSRLIPRIGGLGVADLLLRVR